MIDAMSDRTTDSIIKPDVGEGAIIFNYFILNFWTE
jgi:hypothetical protein